MKLLHAVRLILESADELEPGELPEEEPAEHADDEPAKAAPESSEDGGGSGSSPAPDIPTAQEPAAPTPFSREVAMLEYLLKLAEDLPEERLQRFSLDERRLDVARLASILDNRKPLRSRSRRRTVDRSTPVPSSTRERVANLFRFTAPLAKMHPDEKTGTALSNRMLHVADGCASTET